MDKKTPENIKTGQIGEELARKYLKNKGYKVISSNYRKTYGEIDIIAKEGPTLVFVEVKTLKEQKKEGLVPEDNLTSEKLRKLKRICQLYANDQKDLNEKSGWRIDLVTISIPIDIEYNNLTELSNSCEIRHYESI